MKLEDALRSYYEFSGLASSVNRQIGFAGIAVIWIFCQLKNGKLIVPDELILPAIFIIISLGLDLLQYVFGSLVWGIVHRHNERKDRQSFTASRFLNYPQLFCLWTKLVSMIIAYYLLIDFLVTRIN